MGKVLPRIAGLLLLVVALVALWNFRYTMENEAETVSLETFRAAYPELPPGADWEETDGEHRLRIRRCEGEPPVVLNMRLPYVKEVDGGVLVKCVLKAQNLHAGDFRWEDGRILLCWNSPEGEALGVDPVGSARDDETSDEKPFVLVPDVEGAIPELQIEHLGQAGELVVEKLELVPVRERRLWRYGRWGLFAGWATWLFLFLRGPPTLGWIRKATAVGLWLALAMSLAVPGPWENKRPLVFSFQCERVPGSGASASNLAVDSCSHLIGRAEGKQFGKLPMGGSAVLKIKQHFKSLRPLLHSLLFFAPTLLLIWLVGRRQALILAFGLVAAIEVAQTAYGYGFDTMDVLDLLTDSIGITAALFASRWLCVWWRRKNQVRRLAQAG